MSAYMDYTPRRLIAMTRAGMKDEVLGSFSIWVCASCYACTAACPKQIPITDIMYALKRTAIREGVHPTPLPSRPRSRSPGCPRRRGRTRPNTRRRSRS